jgi:hypothetical protein
MPACRPASNWDFLGPGAEDGDPKADRLRPATLQDSPWGRTFPFGGSVSHTRTHVPQQKLNAWTGERNTYPDNNRRSLLNTSTR